MINEAYAQTQSIEATTLADGQAPLGPPEKPGSAIATMLPLVLMLMIFYFLLIRPQQKKIKAHGEMVNQLSRGTKILTSGGIIGTIVAVNSDNKTLTVEIADGVEVTIYKHTINEVIKDDIKVSTPSSNKAKGGKKSKNKPKKAA